MHNHFPHGTPVCTSAEIRQIERATFALPEPPPLMARAGFAAAELARELAGQSGKPVLVLAGPGNNGGDAFVVARWLKRWFFGVTVVFTGDERHLSGDAAAARAAWRDAGGTTIGALPAAPDWALVVDGLFGIGLARNLDGDYARLIERVNNLGVPVLALDVPSGLAADSGRILGSVLRARHTITFIALKPGLLTLDGPDCCGHIHVAPLGLDIAKVVTPAGSVPGHECLATLLPPRNRNTHKGTYGSVGVIGGAPGMAGAALLAARAALKLGAGRVYAGFIDSHAPGVDPVQPELMLRAADAVLKLDYLTCLAVGPGMGESPTAASCLRQALNTAVPIVLDADALNEVARDSELQNVIKQRVSATLLTPHPAEAARLLGCATSAIQHDRVAAACRLAAEYNAGVVLKGAGSVCAWPDGTWTVNTSGNPGMAAAGMGDALTGFIAALLAQGVEQRIALPAAVYLHGAAADAAVDRGIGPVGLTASDVIDAARILINSRRRDAD